MDLNNSVVLVTGASSGIGAATAQAASRAGARVVLAARREDRIRQLATDLGDALAVGCDVTDAGQVADAAEPFVVIGAKGLPADPAGSFFRRR